ncbi:MAG: MFS transporter [Sphingobium sp.]
MDITSSPSGTLSRRQPSVGLVHFALAVGGFAIGTTEFAMMSLLPYFAPDLHIDEPTAGHVISAYALGVVVGAPLLAVMGARMPRRTLLILLMSLFALANAATAFAPNYGWMMVFRFLSGLPHGAYFGVASLLAASLVPPHRRTAAVGRTMMGLTIATIVGVPLANGIGLLVGWRWCFGLVAALALTTVILIAWLAPHEKADPEARIMDELGGLANGQVWLVLAIGAIGFGGVFCVYTYLASTMRAVTRTSAATIPVMLAVFGVGMTLGNLVAPRLAARGLMRAAAGVLIWSVAALSIYPVATGNIYTLALVVLAIGGGGALPIILQTRLMDVAGKAQTLAAALNHAAFNFANALGPLVGGLAIGAGWGLASTGYVGAGLAAGGLVICVVAMLLGGGREAEMPHSGERGTRSTDPRYSRAYRLPPSTATICPVMKDAPSDRRNLTVSA